MSTSSPFWWEMWSSIGPPPARLMSPTTTRGARGCAARYASVTEAIARIVRSFPYSRSGAFGTLSVIGFHVTQSGPLTGSCVPPIRLPPYGSPTDVAWCHSILGAALAFTCTARR